MSEIRSRVKLFKSRESDRGVEQCVSITLGCQLTRGDMPNTAQHSRFQSAVTTGSMTTGETEEIKCHSSRKLLWGSANRHAMFKLMWTLGFKWKHQKWYTWEKNNIINISIVSYTVLRLNREQMERFTCIFCFSDCSMHHHFIRSRHRCAGFSAGVRRKRQERWDETREQIWQLWTGTVWQVHCMSACLFIFVSHSMNKQWSQNICVHFSIQFMNVIIVDTNLSKFTISNAVIFISVQIFFRATVVLKMLNCVKHLHLCWCCRLRCPISGRYASWESGTKRGIRSLAGTLAGWETCTRASCTITQNQFVHFTL